MAEEKRELKTIASKILKYFAYLWLIAQFIAIVLGIIGISFVDIKDEPKIWIPLLLGIGLLIFGAPFLLLKIKLWEKLGRWLFRRRISDSERFFFATSKDEGKFFRAILYSRLSGSDRDDKTLNILQKESVGNDPVYAIKMGLHNSRLFHVLGNNYLRVLNGFWTIVAANNARTSGRIKTDEYVYALASACIDDIGWAANKMEQGQLSSIATYFEKHIKSHLDADTINLFEANKANAKELAITFVKHGIGLLGRNKDKFNSLRAVGYRHLSSLTPAEAIQYHDKSVVEIRKIQAAHDKKIMELGEEFSEIERNLSCNEVEELRNYYDKIEEIRQSYEDLGDYERVGKCFYLAARVLICLKKFDATKRDSKVIQTLEEGIKHNETHIRYDEMLNCLFALSQYYLDNENSERAKEKAREGYRLALTLRNQEFVRKFSRICLPKRIILFRHGEAEKNICATINGSGSLTDQGRADVEKSIKGIKRFLLEQQGYDLSKISVIGSTKGKQQVADTLEIFRDSGFIDIKGDADDLRPTHMGVLAGVSEINPSEKLRGDLCTMLRWRNKSISLAEFNIEGMEKPEEFWQRGKRFIDSIRGNECSIVVCTTSIAILLTYCLAMDELNKNDYWHIDVPLCGLISFLDEDGKYRIVNKDHNRNILFTSLEESAKEEWIG